MIYEKRTYQLHRFYFQLVPSMRHTEEIEFGLLPTPVVMDTNQGDLEKIDQRRQRALNSKKNGNGFGQTLGELANRSLLPTPDCSDRRSAKSKQQGLSNVIRKLMPMASDTGKTSQLNPRFVAEMMGFPPNWTQLPFQSGETNLSKDMEMQ